MVSRESLPERVQDKWINCVNQVSGIQIQQWKSTILINMVKYYFGHTIYDVSDVNVAKKGNSYMFLITPRFKFLDIRNYLAPGLSYDGWCKVNGCVTEKLVSPYEW